MTELIEPLVKAAGLMDQILERTTGLDQLDRKIVVYYTLATHCIEHVSTFPMLVLLGPMGTGKSQTLLVAKAFAYRPSSFSLRGRTLPTIRDELAADCRRRRVDVVLVYRYDRFARSLRQLVNALEDFRSLGIDFISLHEGVDTSTANGRLVFGIFASIAEFERELIRDRMRSGLAAARAKGKRLGRPRVVVDAPRIATLRDQGRSWREITVATGISKGTAQRALSSLPKIV